MVYHTIDRVFTNFLVVHTNENVCVHIIIILSLRDQKNINRSSLDYSSSVGEGGYVVAL
jgi:hypothetical protein